ncbi:MAG: hypothetical protein ABIN00_08215 [candidate division WOR-3 bacterium]
MNKKDLSKPMKIAATKTLKELGFSVRKIAEIMGVDKNTILRYQKKELEPEFRQFADTIKKIYLEHDFELAELAYQKMKLKIDRARFFELVGLYKTVRELQQPKEAGGVNVSGEKVIVFQVVKDDGKGT